MLFRTHLLLGIIFFLALRNFLSGGNELLFFLLVLLGSILPDIDEPSSTTNRGSGIIGKVVAVFSRHRGFFHSLLFGFLVLIGVSSLWNVYYASGLFLGFLAHLVGDSLTPRGIAFLYPFSSYRVQGLVRTGGLVEAGLVVILVILILRLLF